VPAGTTATAAAGRERALARKRGSGCHSRRSNSSRISCGEGSRGEGSPPGLQLRGRVVPAAAAGYGKGCVTNC
jgi:hypothetical protein